MGAFLYCNKQINTESIKRVLTTRGHKDVQSEFKGNETIVYAGKILTQSTACLSGKQIGEAATPDDYIIGVGTFFYDGDFGEEALRKVYANLDKVLSDNPVYGHWAFVVHKEGVTYVLNDMNGTLRLYSYEKDGKVVVSSSPLAVVAAIEEPRFDKVLLSAYLAGRYGDEVVPVEGVRNVDPLQYMVVKSGVPEYVRRVVPDTKRIETLEEAVSYVRELFQDQLKQLKAIGDERVSIELTAGLDSRLIASNLKTAGFNYDFLNYPLFGPDKEVAEMIAKGLGKRILTQTNKPCTEDFENHYGEWDYGFNFFRQYANPRWVIENRFQFSGARGECLDLPVIYSDEDISMMEGPRLVKLLPPLTSTKMMNDDKREEYLGRMKDFFALRGFDPDQRLSEKQQLQFCQMLGGQLTGDYMYNSGVQAHIYFYQIYNEWHFNHFITDIAFDAKSGRKLTLALIKVIDPELGSYPFVSRRRTKRKSVNETNELPKQYWSYGGIKKMLPKAVVNFLFEKMGRKFSRKLYNNIDFEYYSDVVKTEELKKYPNLYSITLNRMYSIEVLRKIMNIA